MIYHALFVEQPYAAALSNENLAIRCSKCLTDGASIPCSTCKRVVYCNEECRALDQPIHMHECQAFKKKEGANIDEFVRFLGRILTRRSIDHGVAHLCENFPSNIPDRRLDDLMPHLEDIAGGSRASTMDKTLEKFMDAFSGTPLVDDWNLVRRMYCIMSINCFSISGAPNLAIAHDPWLGLGIYLNVSRFNHSCKPNLHVFFDGPRLVIHFPTTNTDEGAMAKQRLAFTESPEKFNGLTINYGFSSEHTCGHFPLRAQRREWLKFAYFFECHCDCCDDDHAAALEEHAAAIECPKCGEPYLWKEEEAIRRSVQCWRSESLEWTTTCQKSCDCVSDDKEKARVKAYVKKCKNKSGEKHWYKRLGDEWSWKVLRDLKDLYASDVINECEPLWEKARLVWHRTANLRMNHLQERIFVCCQVEITDMWEKKKTIDARILKLGLETGEASLGWYKWDAFHLCFDTAIVSYSYKLAQLYEIAVVDAGSTKKAVEYWNRCSHWYSNAATVWMAYGKYTKNLVTELLGEAEKAKKEANAVMVTTK